MPQALLKWDDQQFDVTPFLKPARHNLSPIHVTAHGALYAADCMKLLPLVKDEVVDTIFADPPFNIGKEYGKNTDDCLPDEHYIQWCREWLAECVRVLKPGGSLFLYNLPKWNVLLGAFLHEQGLEFRHWIAIEISACLPIPSRLHPSHYSLLYYSKGKVKTFYRIRTPILTCRHCGGEVKDYGGHRDAMNPKGVTLKDVWTDIPPVRHWKFKSRNRRANALSTKILDRVIDMSTDIRAILYWIPSAGAEQPTWCVSQNTGIWIGSEIDYAEDIVSRLETDEIHAHKNGDFVER